MYLTRRVALRIASLRKIRGLEEGFGNSLKVEHSAESMIRLMGVTHPKDARKILFKELNDVKDEIFSDEPLSLSTVTSKTSF